MTRYICRTEPFEHRSLDPLDPPEFLAEYEEIEAENRSKAKWKFIKKCFGSNRSLKGLPKIYIEKAKQIFVLEENEENEYEKFLLDEKMETVCLLKFENKQQINKFIEMIHLSDAYLESITPVDFDTGKKIENEEAKKVVDDSLSLQVKRAEEAEEALRLANETILSLRKEIADKQTVIFEKDSKIIGALNKRKLEEGISNKLNEENLELKKEFKEAIQMFAKEQERLENEITSLTEKLIEVRNENSQELKEEIEQKNKELSAGHLELFNDFNRITKEKYELIEELEKTKKEVENLKEENLHLEEINEDLRCSMLKTVAQNIDSEIKKANEELVDDAIKDTSIVGLLKSFFKSRI